MENDPGVSGPPFLEIDEFHLSPIEAKEYVIDKLREDGVRPPSVWEKVEYQYVNNFFPKKKKFRDLVLDARNTGWVAPVQKKFDARDEIFGGQVGHSTSPMPGMQFRVSFAGHTKVLKAPFLDIPSEMSISDDILFYREETCYESSNYDFILCARNYRGYLSSCISLIDAFINKYILYYQFKNPHSLESLTLGKVVRSNLEVKLETFLKISTGRDMSALKGGIEWKRFKSLKKLRNEMVHINTPSLGYSILDFPEHLNYAREGIGGLLFLIRQLQNKKTLGFIERIKSAPLVRFNKSTIQNNFKSRTPIG